MTNKEAIRLLERIQNPEPWEPAITEKAYEALDMAVSALEKQEADSNKCCETCKHRNRSSQEMPCCDCYLATAYEDCYEAEEEA